MCFTALHAYERNIFKTLPGTSLQVSVTLKKLSVVNLLFLVLLLWILHHGSIHKKSITKNCQSLSEEEKISTDATEN
jgi:hypothetical protein